MFKHHRIGAFNITWVILQQGIYVMTHIFWEVASLGLASIHPSIYAQLCRLSQHALGERQGTFRNRITLMGTLEKSDVL